jgi:LacI family transcriptional regulator
MAEPKVTIFEIAKRANVSFRTVSKVINQKPGVGASKRAEIEALIVETGYTPSQAAQALSSKKTNLIGLLLSSADANYFLLDLQFGATAAALERDYHLVIEGVSTADGLGKALERLSIDGAILAPPLCDDLNLLDRLDAQSIPYVRVSPSRDVDRGPSVRIDAETAGFDATARLIAAGHSDIAFIYATPGYTPPALLLDGYRSALAAKGLRFRPELVRTGDDASETGFKATEALLRLTSPPTAIFCASDTLALGAMAACRKFNIEVPAGLSLIGFDDAPGVDSVWPPLSTISNPVHGLGEAAVGLLLDCLTLPNRKRLPITLPYNLIERGTIGVLEKTAPAS